MLQKVAAMVDKVAADLGLRAYEVRWLLHKKYLDFAASSAATLCVPLYIIVLPYFRHFGSFVPKICKFCDKRRLKQAEGVDYQRIPLGCFFCYFFLRAEDCAESEVIRNPCRFNFSIQSVTVVTPPLPSALRRCFSLRHLKGEYLWYTTEKVP